MGRKKIDLTGQRFGRLVVVKESEHRIKGNITWECLCDCGNRKDVIGKSLKSGNTKSCGCLGKEHITDINKKRKGKDLITWRNQNDLVESTKLTSINRKRFKNNQSGVTGVSFNKKKKLWLAQLDINGECVLKSYFHNKQDAIDARKEAEEEYFKPILEKYGKRSK